LIGTLDFFVVLLRRTQSHSDGLKLTPESFDFNCLHAGSSLDLLEIRILLTGVRADLIYKATETNDIMAKLLQSAINAMRELGRQSGLLIDGLVDLVDALLYVTYGAARFLRKGQPRWQSLKVLRRIAVNGPLEGCNMDVPCDIHEA
jgi:hypothetical protein